MNSLSALGVAGYICYYNMDNINQLFLCGLDVIILTVVNMVMAGANSHKNDDFFEVKEGEMTLNKRVSMDDSVNAEDIQPDGVMSQNVSVDYGKKYRVEQESQNSIQTILGVEADELVVVDEIGDEAVREEGGIRRGNSRLGSVASKNQPSRLSMKTPSQLKSQISNKVSYEDVSIQAYEILSMGSAVDISMSDPK